jgi:hypothetical protein
VVVTSKGGERIFDLRFPILLHCLGFNVFGEIIAFPSPDLNTDEVPSWQVLIIDESS